ncbi:hypothetical protein E3T61_00905 [Cryobacterium lactosi]|uniref:Uncharacterized protein n=1 Tax=Cryobacterium lactosi TaxID=1259202 RepID=A0A4R9BZJ7_9MICO|nr:hypothetical protein [Cryobacterium lactosi]TFD95226.1 hypothetical protein E3T61_00905 [Cryobacterium lactosi]
MTTILHTLPSSRSLRPVVMTASVVTVSPGGHGPADLPVSIDRAPAHAMDRIALWADQPGGVERAA